MKKLITTLGISTLLLTAPVTSLAVTETPLWDNPTEYNSLPSTVTDANKTEKLLKGHTYQINFDAETYGENVLLVYAQNKSYLNEFITLTQEWQHFEFTITPKTNTHVVFEDLQHLGDINLKNITIVEVK
jgi:hypothetical protein